MKALHLERDRYPAKVLTELEKYCEIKYLEGSSQSDFADSSANSDVQALFTRLGLSVDSAILDDMPNLKIIVTPTTGLDHIDAGACARRGIEIISLKGETRFLETVKSTAEHTWALLMALCRKIPWAHSHVMEGRWERVPFLGMELSGKTLVVVGYGRLGKMVARYGEAFGMKVLAHDISEDAFKNSILRNFSLAELLPQADVISLHLPHTEKTRCLFGTKLFDSLKTGALFINTARGELVDEGALLRALDSGQLAGAALDVLNGDSAWDGKTPADHPLIAYAGERDNLLLTPHIGGYGRDSIQNTRQYIVRKFLTRIEEGI